MSKKTKYNSTGINNLPNDKPVVYQIKTEGGKLNYAGIAKRGRVRERIKEHIGKIPGVAVEVRQFNSIADAKKNETNTIQQTQPKYNKKLK